MSDSNRKELDKQHDKWLEPPDDIEHECEVCGATVDVSLCLTGYLCFGCDILDDIYEDGEDGW